MLIYNVEFIWRRPTWRRCLKYLAVAICCYAAYIAACVIFRALPVMAVAVASPDALAASKPVLFIEYREVNAIALGLICWLCRPYRPRPLGWALAFVGAVLILGAFPDAP